jgi:hypothetical protein
VEEEKKRDRERSLLTEEAFMLKVAYDHIRNVDKHTMYIAFE